MSIASCEAVAQRLPHERVIRDLDRAALRVLLAGRPAPGRPRRAGRRRACAGGTAGPSSRAPYRSTASARDAFQRQRVPNIGAARIACSSVASSWSERTKWNASVSGKLWAVPIERTIASSVAAAWSSKSNETQKRLRSARPKARLTRPPKGACTTSCIPPASSKNRSKTTSSIVGTTPERVALRRDVRHDLRRAGGRQGALRGEPLAAAAPPASIRRDDVRAQPAHLRRELPGARRRLARARRGSTAAAPARPPPAARRARDSTRRMRHECEPEDEDVAGHALDRPVLVDRADERLVGVEHDAVVGEVGDRAAVGERHDARRAPPAQRPVDAIPVHESAPAPEPAARPLRETLATTSSNSAALELCERRRLAERVEERVFASIRGRSTRRRSAGRGRRAGPAEARRDRAVPRATARTSAAHSTSSSRDVAKRRPRDVRPSAWPDRPMRWSSVVTARGEPIWQTEIHRADVDPELERRRRHERAHLARLQALLDAQAAVLREAAVVGSDAVLAEPLAEVVRDALGHPARVDEDERRPVRFDRARRGGRRSRSTARASRPPAGPSPAPRSARSRSRRCPTSTMAHGPALPDEEPRGLLDGVHGGREADPLRPRLGDRVESGEREREVAAALVAHQGVELVDDDRAHPAKERRGSAPP